MPPAPSGGPLRQTSPDTGTGRPCCSQLLPDPPKVCQAVPAHGCTFAICTSRGLKGILSTPRVREQECSYRTEPSPPGSASGRDNKAQSQGGRSRVCAFSSLHPNRGPLHYGMLGTFLCRQPLPGDSTSRVHPCDVILSFPDVMPGLSARPAPKANLDVSTRSRLLFPRHEGGTVVSGLGVSLSLGGFWGYAGREETPQRTRAAQTQGAATCVGVGSAGEKGSEGRGEGSRLRKAHGALSRRWPACVEQVLRGKSPHGASPLRARTTTAPLDSFWLGRGCTKEP